MLNRRSIRVVGALAAVILVLLPGSSGARWSKRAGDLQNTGHMGQVSGLGPADVTSLETRHFPTGLRGVVNVTPLPVDGLLYFGDWGWKFWVYDLQTGKALIELDTTSNQPYFWEFKGKHQGIQSTPAVGEVTVDRENGVKRTHVYFGATSFDEGLWCLDADAIEADVDALRAAASPDDGTKYVCDGWPKSVVALPDIPNPVTGPTESVLQGSVLLSTDQPIDVDGDGTPEVRDILYTPTNGIDCGNGQMWAMDALTGEVYWEFDPVVQGDGLGGTMWLTPAMDADKKTLFIATGNCVNKPQAGEYAESVVALDASTGKIKWFHQRRLIDTADMDIGVSPTVVDKDLDGNGSTDGEGECSVVVNPDKDGCIYAFRQDVDLPEVGDLGFDPLRPGQQRLLWRQCMVVGSVLGGFNAGSGGYADGVFIAQISGNAVPVGADDASAFGLDPCTGKVLWASSTPGRSFADQTIANGMAFFMGPTDVQILDVETGAVRGSVALGGYGTVGGGGMSIADGAVFVPVSTGVIEITSGGPSGSSAPAPRGTNSFAGPYPLPIAPTPGSAVMTEERMLHKILPPEIIEQFE